MYFSFNGTYPVNCESPSGIFMCQTETPACIPHHNVKHKVAPIWASQSQAPQVEAKLNLVFYSENNRWGATRGVWSCGEKANN